MRESENLAVGAQPGQGGTTTDRIQMDITCFDSAPGAGDVKRYEIGGYLGKYVIKSYLGAGGMGVVYRGFDPLVERDVALKVLPSSLSVSSQAQQRFLSEARAVGKLIHPNATALYEVGEQDGAYFLAMEFVGGGSIASLLNEQRLPVERATRYLAEVCFGLAAAHEVGLIHRDIKPENLLRTTRDHLQALENFSKQAIDLLDRNLFERAADIRWWSTDQFFWTALRDPTPENFQKAAHRMEVINGSYTMYRNLVLANRNGEIVASAKSEDRNKVKSTSVYDDPWFLAGMRTTKSSEFAVQDVQKSKLEPRKERSLIYSGGVRAGGERQGDPIGVVGILFDWDTEAKKILSTCLPKNRDGESIAGCAAFYTNSDHEIIETTDEQQFPVGNTLSLPAAHQTLKAGQSASGLFVHQDRRYILGSSRTKGYREYAGLAWTAHVVRPI